MEQDGSDLPEDEATLVALMGAGDQRAFARLFHRFQAPVYRFVKQMSGSAHIAEDVTQEVFIAFLGTADRFDATRGSLKVYLYGIARNFMRRELRRQTMQREVEIDRVTEAVLSVAGDTPDVLADLERAAALKTLRRAIVALPAQYREVIVLCELHELSYEEASVIVQCPIGTIRSRLNRARHVLARKCRLDPGVSTETSCAPRRCLA